MRGWLTSTATIEEMEARAHWRQARNIGAPRVRTLDWWPAPTPVTTAAADPTDVWL